MRAVLVVALLAGCSTPAMPIAPRFGDAASAADAAAAGDAFTLDDAGSDAYAAPDAFAIDAAAECTLSPASGCDATHACRLTVDGVHCGAVVERPGESQPCDRATTCASGQQCLSTGGESFCRVWCTSDSDCSQASGPRICTHPAALFTFDTTSELTAPVGVGVCGS